MLRKYLWAIDFAVIALASMFVARATASAIESAYFGAPAVTLARRTPAPVPPGYPKTTDDILKRNIFCSTCPPILPLPASSDGETAPTDATPVKTALPLKLLAVMYSPPPHDPRWSVVVIRDTEWKAAGPFSIGSKLRDATVTDIQETRVYFDNAGKAEYLDLFEKAVPPAGVGPPVVPTGDDAFSRELDKGIKQTGTNSYELQRSTLDAVLTNMSMLSRSARIVPEIKDGKPAGFRLYSVRPDGPFAKIGLQNGDVVSAINGLEMSSPEQALSVYTKLRSASHLSIGLERNGQKLTKEYNVR